MLLGHLPVCDFSACSAEKSHTIKEKYRSAKGEQERHARCKDPLCKWCHSCPQKRSAVIANVRATAFRSAIGTYSSGRCDTRTSPGPNMTVGVLPTLTSSRMSAP